MSSKKAVILLSGGLDSATCLAIAREQGFTPVALSFDYGQRHHAELAASRRVAEHFEVSDHRILRLDLGTIGGSALTDTTIQVPTEEAEGIPVTYVPARNTVFLSFALGLAEVVAADDIFIGVNAVDYSGYPDCRPAFIQAFETMANLATKAGVEGHRMRIHAPLMTLSKADIIKMGMRLGVDYALTVSCYQADENGQACGLCDSCRLRRKGFEEAQMPDPTRYKAPA
jgi:7-cyano-7-deazaguanine synthase